MVIRGQLRRLRFERAKSGDYLSPIWGDAGTAQAPAINLGSYQLLLEVAVHLVDQHPSMTITYAERPTGCRDGMFSIDYIKKIDLYASEREVGELKLEFCLSRDVGWPQDRRFKYFQVRSEHGFRSEHGSHHSDRRLHQTAIDPAMLIGRT